MTKVILPPWRKLINTHFVPLVKNTDRYLILYGSRGSSKSDMVAKKLIRRCMSENYFRYILYRKIYNTIHDSQFQNIKDIVEEWGLSSLFSFTENPLLIKCINGNRFLCRGGDKPEKLKSIKDPTGIWYEEDIPSEDDFITISTSIRSQKADYLQEIFSVNPVVEGNYEENWFWRRFFGKENEDGSWSPKTTELSFHDVTKVEIPATIFEAKRIVERKYTTHQSTWKHNRWLTDDFIAQLLALKETNPYWYNVYTEGLWANKTSKGNFYNLFSREKNIKHIEYDPMLPIHLTFDFNVHPHITICVWQIKGKKCYQIDEICPEPPKNRTNLACQEFAFKYRAHKGGLFVYGDPAGLHEDTRTEQGSNDFFIIGKELSTFRPQMRYRTQAPPVKMRGLWINEIFHKGFEDIEVFFNDTCKKTAAEYENLKEAADGTKAKVKTKNKETGISFEQYGHISDANDYLLCSVFPMEFVRFQMGSVGGNGIKMGSAHSKNSY